MHTLSSSGDPQRAHLIVSLPVAVLGLLAVLVLGPVAPAAAQPERGGTVVWAVHEYMPSFDIMYETSYIAGQPLGPLYNGLLAFDVYGGNKIVGDLAERWDVAEDGTRLTFRLRKGVKFHDGSALSCADAQWSLDRFAKRSNPTFTSILKDMYAASKCADDFTLVVSLKRPAAGFLTLLAGVNAVVMKHGIDERADKKSPAFLIGTGRWSCPISPRSLLPSGPASSR